MKNSLVFLISCLFSWSLLAQTDIYFLRGNVIDYHANKLQKVMGSFENFIIKNFPQAHFETFHNHKWDNFCKIISKRFTDGEFKRLIIVGHSWGVAESYSLSECLFEEVEIKVDFLLSIDPIQKPFRLDIEVVPDSISNITSFYQRQDLVLKGAFNLSRADGSKDGIEEHFVEVKNFYLAHDRIFEELFAENILQQIMYDKYYSY